MTVLADDPDDIWDAMCIAMDRDAVAAGWFDNLPGDPPSVVELPLMSDLAQSLFKATFDGRDDDPARTWLLDNVMGTWRIDGAKIIFTHRTDAMLFILAHRSADCALKVNRDDC